MYVNLSMFAAAVAAADQLSLRHIGWPSLLGIGRLPKNIQNLSKITAYVRTHACTQARTHVRTYIP